MTDAELTALWPEGARVERVRGGQRLTGHVLFVHGGWVYWRADDRSRHASQPDTLRRVLV